MTKDEALKLALEAFEEIAWSNSTDWQRDRAKVAITAIKEALAQPEQELLAWKNAALRVGEDLSSIGPNGYYNMTAQQWLDWAMAQQPRGNNSLAQPEQEPVAWATQMGEYAHIKWGAKRPEYPMVYEVPLYTTTPQRTWAALMRGVRVECDTVVISTKDNEVARVLCGALIEEMNK